MACGKGRVWFSRGLWGFPSQWGPVGSRLAVSYLPQPFFSALVGGKCLHKLCQMSSPEMLVINFFCSLWVGMYRINHSAGEKPPGMRVSADILACQTRWSLVWGDSGLAAHIERALTYLGAITLMAVAEEFCGEIPRMWGPFSHSLRQPSYGWRNHCLRSFYYWQLVR